MVELVFFVYAAVSLAIIYGLLVTIDRDRKAHTDHISELLNRIKPETAQIPNIDSLEVVEPIRTDDDYWDSHETSIKEDGTFPYGGYDEAMGR